MPLDLGDKNLTFFQLFWASKGALMQILPCFKFWRILKNPKGYPSDFWPKSNFDDFDKNPILTKIKFDEFDQNPILTKIQFDEFDQNPILTKIQFWPKSNFDVFDKNQILLILTKIQFWRFWPKSNFFQGFELWQARSIKCIKLIHFETCFWKYWFSRYLVTGCDQWSFFF